MVTHMLLNTVLGIGIGIVSYTFYLLWKSERENEEIDRMLEQEDK